MSIDSPCPHCQTILRGHTSVSGKHAPAAGDLSMCATCGGLLQFDDSLQLAPLSEADAPEELLQLRRGFLRAKHDQANPSPRNAMTISEALAAEMDRGMSVIAATVDAECHVCHEMKELRAGTCFPCQDLVRTDLIDVWEVAKPVTNRWPYMYRGEKFADVSEEIAAKAQEFAERINGRKPTE